MVEFIKKLWEPKASYFTVGMKKCLEKKPYLGLQSQRASQVSQFHCPNCDTKLDSVSLRGHSKCFLCGLEMQRIDLNRIRCKK